MIFEVTHDDYDLARPEENNIVYSIIAAVDPPESYFDPRVSTDFLIGGYI